jgi:DNA-binding response OmpR family regulator
MNDVVTKPFDLNGLRGRIDSLEATSEENVALSSQERPNPAASFRQKASK